MKKKLFLAIAAIFIVATSQMQSAHAAPVPMPSKIPYHDMILYNGTNFTGGNMIIKDYATGCRRVTPTVQQNTASVGNNTAFTFDVYGPKGCTTSGGNWHSQLWANNANNNIGASRYKIVYFKRRCCPEGTD